jgi:uncharacterized integral membrane protein
MMIIIIIIIIIMIIIVMFAAHSGLQADEVELGEGQGQRPLRLLALGHRYLLNRNHVTTLGFRVSGVRVFRVLGLGFRFQGFRVWGLRV